MRLLRFLALLGLLPTAAHASVLVIWPVAPVIQSGEQATALWLRNEGREPVTVQVRTLAWSQPNGDEQLDRQDTVVASPPIATVAPGERQLVRIIRRSADAVPERSYRLVIDELPRPPAADAPGALNARLAVQMRYSIPLFTLATATVAPQLDARVVTGPNGRVLLIHNTGRGHARLTDLRVVSGGRETMLQAGLAGYVLPGATIELPLQPGQAGTIKVGVNGTDQLLGGNA